MALYKRKSGGAWWVRFQSRGKTIRRSTGTETRELAEEIEAALRVRYIRQAQLGETVRTWKEAVARYKREATWRDSTKTRNEFALRFFERIDSIAVGAITSDVVRAARDYVERTQQPASANRVMAVFRGVLRACAEWGWITHAPPVPMPHIPLAEITPLTPAQCVALIRELPEHLRAPMIFSVLTGLRAGNVRDLDWSRVNLDAGHVTIPASHYKTKRDQRFPLSTEAVALLSGLPKRTGRVFLYDGKPINGTFGVRAWRKARVRAGLPNLRWHDLRHTFASWLASGGASDRVLQSLGGWTSPKMVSRYAHLRPSDLMPHANALGTIMGTVIENSAVLTDTQTTEKQVVPETGFEPATHALRMPRAKK